MKSTVKQIKLDKNKLFGFKPSKTEKAGNKFARPMIGTKTIGVKKANPLN